MICFVFPRPLGANTDDLKNALVLHSYHHGFDWTDSITEGIKSVLEKSDIKYELYIEHMDVKRHPAKETYPHLEQLFEDRYRNINFDVIILSDDFALDFIIERRSKLFPSVPIVFCGINNYESSRIENVSAITGVAEDIDLKGTIDLALKLHPGIKNVAFISDGAPSGLQMLKRTRKVMSQYREKLELIELFDLSLSELKQSLNRLPEDSIVLHTHYYRDKGSGRALTIEQSFAFVRQNCELPIYTGWDFQIGYGAAGGVVTNGNAQGSLAAKMVLRILRDEQADSIPVIAESPNTPMFDYNYLAPFGIRLSDLPKGSIVINEPISFYYRHKSLVWLTSCFIFVLCLIIISLITNILRRKQAEDALREGEEKYRDLVENIIDVIYAVDHKGVITYVSPSVISMLGYQPEEIQGRPFFDFIHPEDLPRVNEIFREVLVGKIEPSEYRILRKSGATLWIRSSSRPIYEGKQPVGLRGVLVDITESRLLQDQLRQAQKMEAIGTLAGGVAHDFNNILGIIVGNTELAMDDVPDWNPAHHNLEEVRKACLRARDMVRQILAFSRHTDQKLDAVNINPIIRESLRLIRSSIPTTIDIRQNIPRDTGIIKADPTQINQILINLCTNAAHAMGDNGGVLEVGLENAELNEETVTRYPNLSPGRYVRLWVKDTGHGIEPDHLERIFDPYFTTKDVDEGTGMGLAVVHGIVKNHDGAIRAWSEPGKGTTFEVLFPIVGGDVEPRKKTYEPIPKGNKRILFVDDERLMTETVKTMLERLGYHVNAKMSSVDALDLFREDPHSFDLVITDMTMPKMTGDQLTKALLQIRADMPIILCTGHSNRIDEEKAMELGVRAFVLKPIVVREMAEAIRRVLDA